MAYRGCSKPRFTPGSSPCCAHLRAYSYCRFSRRFSFLVFFFGCFSSRCFLCFFGVVFDVFRVQLVFRKNIKKSKVETPRIRDRQDPVGFWRYVFIPCNSVIWFRPGRKTHLPKNFYCFSCGVCFAVFSFRPGIHSIQKCNMVPAELGRKTHLNV